MNKKFGLARDGISAFSAAIDDYKDQDRRDNNDYHYFTLTKQYTKHSAPAFLFNRPFPGFRIEHPVSSIEAKSIGTILFCQAGWQAFLFWLDDILEGNFEIHVLGAFPNDYW